MALKVVRPSSLSSKDADRLRRFEQEARVAAALNHPNIVSIFDVVTHDGMPFIVCEIVGGLYAAGALERRPLPVRQGPGF